MAKVQSELSVITKSKELCSYIMTVTQKSPKHFRYTFVSRLQNLSMDILENLYRANEVFLVKGDTAAIEKRLDLQRQAMTNLKLIAYFSQLAMEQGCILKIRTMIVGCCSIPQNRSEQKQGPPETGGPLCRGVSCIYAAQSSLHFSRMLPKKLPESSRRWASTTSFCSKRPPMCGRSFPACSRANISCFFFSSSSGLSSK